jgi:hypothetical protein
MTDKSQARKAQTGSGQKSDANLGQKEAALEKKSKAELGRMDDERAHESASREGEKQGH